MCSILNLMSPITNLCPTILNQSASKYWSKSNTHNTNSLLNVASLASFSVTLARQCYDCACFSHGQKCNVWQNQWTCIGIDGPCHRGKWIDPSKKEVHVQIQYCAIDTCRHGSEWGEVSLCRCCNKAGLLCRPNEPCLKTGSATGGSASSWVDSISRRIAYVSNTKLLLWICDCSRRKQTAMHPRSRRRTRKRRIRLREVIIDMSACLRVTMETSISWHPAESFAPRHLLLFLLSLSRSLWEVFFSGEMSDMWNQEFHSEIEIKTEKKIAPTLARWITAAWNSKRFGPVAVKKKKKNSMTTIFTPSAICWVKNQQSVHETPNE